MKWYESSEEDGIVISSRIRLARNAMGYPFPGKMREAESVVFVRHIREMAARLEKKDGVKYYSRCMNELSGLEKTSLQEWRLISDLLAQRKQEAALMLSADEGLSIMINEEDHIRIQSMAAGADLDGAYCRAARIDACFEELNYAFDPQYGYLTASPQNAGTGMRASYLAFLPALSLLGKMPGIAQEAGKCGALIRGMAGEGMRTGGYLYRISNRKAWGCTEEEIIHNLKQVLRQIIDEENQCRAYIARTNADEIEDKVYRSYGVLRYAKMFSVQDGVLLLAQLKLGQELGMISLKKEINLYEQIAKIQPANLQRIFGKELSDREQAVCRAEYLNRLMEMEDRE